MQPQVIAQQTSDHNTGVRAGTFNLCRCCGVSFKSCASLLGNVTLLRIVSPYSIYGNTVRFSANCSRVHVRDNEDSVIPDKFNNYDSNLLLRCQNASTKDYSNVSNNACNLSRQMIVEGEPNVVVATF